ncbi:30S ribosomal protein S6 [Candidatus Saccharibacteria bacterium]|nr:30S ribosomal protein S6 [Candidatus Saccharibacteria bacterium]
MKIYELTVLIHPDLEMNLEPALKKVENAVLESGGKIVKTTDDGKKRLTYAIEGNEYAIFYFYDVELPADAPQKISNALNIADEVIRYLLTVKDERKEKMEARRLEMEKAEAAEAVEEVAEAEKVAEEVIEGATEEVDEKASEESKK